MPPEKTPPLDTDGQMSKAAETLKRYRKYLAANFSTEWQRWIIDSLKAGTESNEERTDNDAK